MVITIEEAPRLIDEAYSQGSVGVPPYLSLYENQHVVFRQGSQSVLLRRAGSRLVRVAERTCYGLQGRSVEQKAALDVLCDPDVPHVSLLGKAGSGKTLLALAAALDQRRNFHRILVARPMVPLDGHDDMGYLPGEIGDKLAPWMAPIHDNLGVLKELGHKEDIEKMLHEKKVDLCPLAYIRGRSMHKVFLIVDEAQNLTTTEIKAIGTRMGTDSKLVFTGDTEQVDRTFKKGQDGLNQSVRATEHSHLSACVRLRVGERSELANLFADCM